MDSLFNNIHPASPFQGSPHHELVAAGDPALLPNTLAPPLPPAPASPCDGLMMVLPPQAAPVVLPQTGYFCEPAQDVYTHNGLLAPPSYGVYAQQHPPAPLVHDRLSSVSSSVSSIGSEGAFSPPSDDYFSSEPSSPQQVMLAAAATTAPDSLPLVKMEFVTGQYVHHHHHQVESAVGVASPVAFFAGDPGDMSSFAGFQGFTLAPQQVAAAPVGAHLAGPSEDRSQPPMPRSILPRAAVHRARRGTPSPRASLSSAASPPTHVRREAGLDYNGKPFKNWSKRKYKCNHCDLEFLHADLEQFALHVERLECGVDGAERATRRFKCEEPACIWSRIGFTRKLESQKHYIRKHGEPNIRCPFAHEDEEENHEMGLEMAAGKTVCGTPWHADKGSLKRHLSQVHKIKKVDKQLLDRAQVRR